MMSEVTFITVFEPDPVTVVQVEEQGPPGPPGTGGSMTTAEFGAAILAWVTAEPAALSAVLTIWVATLPTASIGPTPIWWNDNGILAFS